MTAKTRIPKKRNKENLFSASRPLAKSTADIMYEITVGPEETGCRIDRIVRRRLALMPLSAVYALFRKGKIRINDTKVRQNYRLQTGDRLQIDVVQAEVTVPDGPDRSLRNLTGTSFFRNNFSIIYEDTHLIACNKPPGLVVHPGSGHQKNDTLIELATAYLLESGGIVEGNEAALVHRLDRDTSGVILIAKNKRSLRMLHETFKQHALVKEYRAICHGRPPEHEDSVNVSLVRSQNRNSGMKMHVGQTGKEARSRYRLLSFYRGLSSVAVFLETGKTHQIRVQMAYLCAPVVGDVRYGDPKLDREFFHGNAPRLYLHAYRLSFQHPATGKKLTLKAPLPRAFSELLNR
jgi:RluA family pseudouridine synthase